MQLQDIDWNRLWRESRRRRSRKGKGERDWDNRASSFARRQSGSPYVQRFLDYLAPRPEWSVLDVGAGPGTLALPLASMVRRVTAVDFSAKMLAELGARAAAAGIETITCVKAAWEDDWQAAAIAPHDLVIASRSLSVEDLEAALTKIDQWARCRAVIADRVGAGPFDPAVFAALGRDFHPGPDYIYAVNLLYRMGIHARVDFLALEPVSVHPSRAAAEEGYRWMLGVMTAAEERDFDCFMDARLEHLADGRWQLTRSMAPTWALISWDKS